MSDKAVQHQPLQVVVLTGMAGSGKSVALHALEDIGFYWMPAAPKPCTWCPRSWKNCAPQVPKCS